MSRFIEVPAAAIQERLAAAGFELIKFAILAHAERSTSVEVDRAAPDRSAVRLDIFFIEIFL